MPSQNNWQNFNLKKLKTVCKAQKASFKLTAALPTLRHQQQHYFNFNVMVSYTMLPDFNSRKSMLQQMQCCYLCHWRTQVDLSYLINHQASALILYLVKQYSCLTAFISAFETGSVSSEVQIITPIKREHLIRHCNHSTNLHYWLSKNKTIFLGER